MSDYHVRSPGRVTLIGDHTDYSGGYALPMAIDRQTELTATPAETVTVTSSAREGAVTFDPADPTPAGDWGDYVRGWYQVLPDEGYEAPGFDGTVDGDLPVGAGLSSSASLTVGVGALLAAIADLELSRPELARLAHRVETEFVGVDCGLLDQLAVTMGKRNHALFVDAHTEQTDRVHLPEDVAVVVFDSGVERTLAETPYADRRATVTAALDSLGVDRSTAVDMTALSGLPEEQARRLGYVTRENTRVRQALGALDEDNRQRFGAVLSESHEDIAENYDASTDELDWLVECAVENGADGARLTGAGWGGCVVAVCDGDVAAGLAESVVEAYREAFPDRSGEAYRVAPADGVTVDAS